LKPPDSHGRSSADSTACWPVPQVRFEPKCREVAGESLLQLGLAPRATDARRAHQLLEQLHHGRPLLPTAQRWPVAGRPPADAAGGTRRNRSHDQCLVLDRIAPRFTTSFCCRPKHKHQPTGPALQHAGRRLAGSSSVAVASRCAGTAPARTSASTVRKPGGSPAARSIGARPRATDGRRQTPVPIVHVSSIGGRSRHDLTAGESGVL
jgi:hypothetical protein